MFLLTWEGKLEAAEIGAPHLDDAESRFSSGETNQGKRIL